MSKLPAILMFVLGWKVARRAWDDEISAYFILNYYQNCWLGGGGKEGGGEREVSGHSRSQEMLAQHIRTHARQT